jgi:hypothetical protein
MEKLVSSIRSATSLAAIVILIAYSGSMGAPLHARTVEGKVLQVAVTNVEELYAAVNDSHNAGVEIVAAPGTYMLSATDSTGTPRPNGGRLEFQEDMSLVGVVGDRTAVVINAFNLPASSFTGGAVPFGAIRLGRGRNSLEWLTVRDARGGQGNIVSGLTYNGTQFIRVAHIASTGSNSYNLSLFNFGTAPVLDLDIVDNDLFEAFSGTRGGFRIRNSSGNAGGVINARLTGNRIWGNQFSLITNNNATGGVINVRSAGNRYYGNGNGLTILGGLNASGNTINFEGYGDRYADNFAGSTFDRGGLVIVGGENDPGAGLSNGNTVTVSLFGCRFSGNDLWDLAAIGARSFPESLGDPGSNNRVTVNISGMPSQQAGVEFFAHSLPAAFSTTNSVTVNR